MIAPFSFCQVALLKLSVRFDLVALDMCTPKMREAGDTQFTSNHWEQHEMHPILHFKPCNCYMQQVNIKDWSCADFFVLLSPFPSTLAASCGRYGQAEPCPNKCLIQSRQIRVWLGPGGPQYLNHFLPERTKKFCSNSFWSSLSLLFSNCAVRM